MIEHEDHSPAKANIPILGMLFPSTLRLLARCGSLR